MTPAPFTIPGSAAIWLAIGWSVAGVGLLLLLWALFNDCARGRLRCPKCWYDMSGVRRLPDADATPTRSHDLCCSECGHDARTFNRLRKTRRRWRVAFVALLVALLGSAAGTVPVVRQVKKDGWWSMAPDWMLVEIVSWRRWRNPSDQGTPENELATRGFKGTLSDRAIRRLLDESNAIRIRAPERWLWDEDLPIAISGASWASWLRGVEWRVRGSWAWGSPVAIRDVAHQIAIAGIGYAGPMLGAIPSRSEELTCWLTGVPKSDGHRAVTLQAFRPTSPSEVVWSCDFPVTTVLAPHIDEALKPVTPSELAGVVIRIENPTASIWNSRGEKPISIELPENATPELKALVASTVFALRVEFIDRGLVVARGRAKWSQDQIDTRAARNVERLGLRSLSVGRNRYQPESELTARVVTDFERLLPDWTTTRYWMGDITLPAESFIGHARPRPNFSAPAPPPPSGPGPHE